MSLYEAACHKYYSSSPFIGHVFLSHVTVNALQTATRKDENSFQKCWVRVLVMYERQIRPERG